MSFVNRDGEAREPESAAAGLERRENAPWTPVAPPPFAPPPPPPPGSDSDANSVRSVKLEDQDVSHPSSTSQGSSSYHQATPSPPSHYSSYQRARSAPIPTITNYGISPTKMSAYEKRNNNHFSSAPMFRGDPDLRPNTGETNDEYGGIGSLREVVTRLRWMTIASTLLALVWEGFAFPTRLLIEAWIYPAKVVLGGYLGCFCLLLLGVELNVPLRDNFGVLYHPIGRGILLLLMSGMCFGILAAWWELLLGIAFVICGTGYLFVYAKYPEYRQWQDYQEHSIVWSDVRAAIRRRSIAWARPSQSDLSNGWDTVQRESQSLLHHV